MKWARGQGLRTDPEVDAPTALGRISRSRDGGFCSRK